MSVHSKDYEEGLRDGLEEGMYAAWELAHEIYSDYELSELDEIFGRGWTYSNIVELDPQEVMMKVKAYKNAHSDIMAGDIVRYDPENVEGVVISKQNGRVVVIVPVEDEYMIGEWYNEEYTYTGKHADIQSLFAKIEGEKNG